MCDILKSSVFWKIWQRGAPDFISGGGGTSDGLDPALSFPVINWRVMIVYCRLFTRQLLYSSIIYSSIGLRNVANVTFTTLIF